MVESYRVTLIEVNTPPNELGITCCEYIPDSDRGVLANFMNARREYEDWTSMVITIVRRK
jgi:hypothetical protein